MTTKAIVKPKDAITKSKTGSGYNIDPVAKKAIDGLVVILNPTDWQAMEYDDQVAFIRRYINDAEALGISPESVDAVLEGIVDEVTVFDDEFEAEDEMRSLISKITTTLVRSKGLRTVMINGYKQVVGRQSGYTLTGRVIDENHKNVVLGFVRISPDVEGEEYTRLCADLSKDDIDYDRITVARVTEEVSQGNEASEESVAEAD